MLDPGSLLEEDESAEPVQSSLESVRDIPRKTLWAFMTAVLFAHIGLFAASLGLMLVGFRGQRLVGGVIFAGGVLALVGTVAVVWLHEHERKQ